MKRDGRFEPLTVLAQMAALAGVLVGVAVAWIRHEQPVDTPPSAFYEPSHVTGPRADWR